MASISFLSSLPELFKGRIEEVDIEGQQLEKKDIEGQQAIYKTSPGWEIVSSLSA